MFQNHHITKLRHQKKLITIAMYQRETENETGEINVLPTLKTDNRQ